MKIFILGIFFFTALHAQLLVLQNIKALYKNVNLTQEEIKYMTDNKEINSDAVLMASIKLQERLNKLTCKDKNVIEFTLTDNLEIKNIHFLVHANNPEIDAFTEEIIKSTQFTRPTHDLKMRYILLYDYENRAQLIIAKTPQISQEEINEEAKEQSTDDKNTESIKTPQKQDLGELFDKQIVRGTTTFEYNPKEIVRLFETNQDGFIKANNKACASMKIVTLDNKRVNTGYNPWNIKAPLVKGKYKFVIKTAQTCEINIQYP
ncbi:MAG: hypothetical protein PHX13_00340 [Thiovulaceae bacterium]|nr:hypothetical protein [Sulfurimonadaceae bacterium]